MAGLGILLYGVMQSIGFIGRTAEDIQSKRNTMHINDNGQTVCYGRTGHQYINGEKTYAWMEKDKYGHEHRLIVGIDSGKVYSDSFDEKMKRNEEETKKSYDYAVEHNRLAYYDYTDLRFDTPVVREISTGKIITCLYEGTNSQTCKQEYRKWYLTDECYKEYGQSSYKKTATGDMGIVISKEEYIKLGGSIEPNVDHLPTDGKVLNILLDVNCF